jgi:hypothetical protein
VFGPSSTGGYRLDNHFHHLTHRPRAAAFLVGQQPKKMPTAAEKTRAAITGTGEMVVAQPVKRPGTVAPANGGFFENWRCG